MSVARFEVEGDVGIVSLSDSPTNLVGHQMMDELSAAVAEAGRAPIRCLIIRADGPNFSAGANVNIFQDTMESEGHAILSAGYRMIHQIEAFPFPVIAAVQGMCLAAGLEIALAADMIIAGESAHFSQVEALIGATTFLGGAQRLALRCGDARARQIVFSADIYDAATFERWNIINQVVPDGELEAAVRGWAERLAAGPTRAHAMTRRMVRALCNEGLAEADRITLFESPALWESEDMQMGVRRILTEGARQARVGQAPFEGS
ncbi:enoyl-CoA hydratase/isomerase family protein [Pyruvatibacter mobilis]|uniref:enoyl-CoA hydratase/isomerase family protein n=1 Tax=Pyruvatibacter mobilis TaxID=1712261 RepID=UPI003BA8EBD0